MLAERPYTSRYNTCEAASSYVGDIKHTKTVLLVLRSNDAQRSNIDPTGAP